MKRGIISKILICYIALMVFIMSEITVFASYVVSIDESEDNIVTVVVKAKDIEQKSMLFRLETEGLGELKSYKAYNDAYFNIELMEFSWVGKEAPSDETVVLEIEFERTERPINILLISDEDYEISIVDYDKLMFKSAIVENQIEYKKADMTMEENDIVIAKEMNSKKDSLAPKMIVVLVTPCFIFGAMVVLTRKAKSVKK